MSYTHSHALLQSQKTIHFQRVRKLCILLCDYDKTFISNMSENSSLCDLQKIFDVSIDSDIVCNEYVIKRVISWDTG